MNPALIEEADFTHGQLLEIAQMIDGGNEVVDVTQLPHAMVAVVLKSARVEAVFVLDESGTEHRVYKPFRPLVGPAAEHELAPTPT